jgi:5-methylcytosine-specific restriction enzyme subunit McrC
MAQFDLGVPAARIDRPALARVVLKLDRRTLRYRPALTLVDLLLRGESLSLDDPTQDIQLDGFLFDMNAFFQALLSRFLREHLEDFELLDEHRLRGVFFYDPRHNPQNRRGLVPRPDFVVRRDGRMLAVLDAKYRDLWERDLPREMLYQLAVYALTQPDGGPFSIILYPTLTGVARDQVVVFQDVLRGRAQARVILRPVNLLRLEWLVRAGVGAEADRQRRAMALHLIGGDASVGPVAAW